MSGLRRSTRWWGPVLTVLVVLVAAGCAAPVSEGASTDIGTVQQAVVGGTVDNDDDATVALLLQGQVFCTGVLISKTVVLTAGHCVKPTPPDEVYFGTTPGAKGGTRIAVSHARAHPDFDEETLENDIAVIALAKTATAQPAHVRTQSFSEDTVGKTVRLVGFGVTASDASSSSLKKRVGETTIDSFGKTEFKFKPNPATTCSGDSGGPAFGADDDDNDVVIGIASSGDADCVEYGRHIRVDAYEEFITDNAKAYSQPVQSGDVSDSEGCSAAPLPANRSSFGGALFAAAAAFVAARRRHRC